MNVHIHMSFLRPASKFQSALARDGWEIVTAENPDEVDATHPEVADEETARVRLCRLGLLLSGSLRIDFLPRARKVPADSGKYRDN